MRAYDYCNPGDLRYQRSLAVAHDPYPLNDIGPPILGGRPPNFAKPRSEVERAQLFNPPKRPLQPLPTLQPTIVSPQPVQNPFPAPPPVQTIPSPFPVPPPPG
jgi:hypothetical protein